MGQTGCACSHSKLKKKEKACDWFCKLSALYQLSFLKYWSNSLTSKRTWFQIHLPKKKNAALHKQHHPVQRFFWKPKSSLVILLFCVVEKKEITTHKKGDGEERKRERDWEKRREVDSMGGGGVKEVVVEEGLEGSHFSAVVIKACELKRGQSIQLSASTSHQASWRRLKMSCYRSRRLHQATEREMRGRGRGRGVRERGERRESATGRLSQDATILKIWVISRIYGEDM